MSLIYHFKKLPGKKGASIKTPSIPITFSGNSSLNLSEIALVDSGADCSIMPRGLAEVLDLDLSGKKNPSWGLSGEAIECIETNVKLKIGNSRNNYEFMIPILVSPDDNCPVILGRRTFFEKFKITFDGKHGILMLKEYPKGNK